VVTLAPMSQVLSLLEPVVVMFFGAMLGLVDQTATETSGWLRVPALIAALLLVAQAILDFQVRKQEWTDPPSQSVVVTPGSQLVVRQADSGGVENPRKATYRQAAISVRATVANASVRENPRLIYFVMVLSVWLGLATLANPGAPWLLLVFSLLAAFLLFAEAWQMVRSRR
jgi:hypothetical protein